MLRRQLRQVAVTYFTRPTFTGWLIIALWLAIIFYLTFLSTILSNDKRAALGLPSLILPATLLGIWPLQCVENHLKWQFASPRATLTPGYRLPHLAIAIAIVLTLTVLLPWCFAHCAGVSGLSATASCLAAGAAYMLPAGFLAIVFIPFIWIVIWLTTVELDQDVVAAWLNAEGYRAFVFIAVIVGSGSIIGRRIARYARLDEENPLYELPAWELTDDRSARPFRNAKAVAEEVQRQRCETKRSADALDKVIEKSRRWSLWRRMDVGVDRSENAWRDWTFPLAIGCAIMVSMLWQRPGRWTLDGDVWSSVIQWLPFVTFFAGVAPAVWLGNRLPHMTFERLLPLANQAYADALLTGVAVRSIKFWAAVHLVVGIVSYASPWQNVDLPGPGRLGTYLSLSIAGLAATFGAAARFSAVSGVFGAFVAILVGFAATLMLPWHWAGLLPRDGYGAVPFWVVISAATGVLLVRKARIAWREKELG